MAVRAKFRVTNKPTQAWLNLRAQLRALKARGGGMYVKAGFLGTGAERPADGDAPDITNVQIAAIHEYGAPDVKIPPRPFVSPAFDENRPRYEFELRRVVTAFLGGHLSLEKGLGLLGLLMQADIRRYVTEGPEVAPTNAPRTRARKEKRLVKDENGKPVGDVRTLVDTGRMIGSVSWVLVVGPKPTGD